MGTVNIHTVHIGHHRTVSKVHPFTPTIVVREIHHPFSLAMDISVSAPEDTAPANPSVHGQGGCVSHGGPDIHSA